ncbi:hypothetical protein NQZ68_014512 [Dissostichus eleginoides]|nr:hypothetical protein NQZ68_014512 [Dissostichus eleginoides]
MASLSGFVDAPSVSFLDDCKKAQLVETAEHYKIAVVGSKRKDEIKTVIVSSLFEQGVLQKSEFGAAGVVPVVVQTGWFDVRAAKRAFGHAVSAGEVAVEVGAGEVGVEGSAAGGVIGDVEKMVAIPAVVQSFHQAPPVDLQVRGDPRAPEWASPQGVGSGMVPDKKLVCADLDVGSGFEPFITEAVVSVVGSDKPLASGEPDESGWQFPRVCAVTREQSRKMSADPPVSGGSKSGVEHVVSQPDLPSSVSKEEITRQCRLVDTVLKPQLKLHRTELPLELVCKEEEVVSEQQLCIQEKNYSVNQENPEPPQTKEEQEKLCSSEEQNNNVNST